LQTKTNDADGNVTFDPIRFDVQDIGKTYLYEVREVVPEDREANLDYDTTVYLVRVTVEEVEDHEVTTVVHYETDTGEAVETAVFVNTYEEPEPSKPTDPKDPKYPKNPKDPKYPKTPKDPSQKTSWIPRTGEQATGIFIGLGILIVAGVLLVILKRRRGDR
ncbi:MAG: LPXTG cell wall anchor domain-containing protein, partial [Clostridiaceae bacterium]|nr:LPXTG cell wall anchor domain-containing protein [Clostridiaceae bacterium]